MGGRQSSEKTKKERFDYAAVNFKKRSHISAVFRKREEGYKTAQGQVNPTP